MKKFFRVIVDYSKTLAEMIKVGQYLFTNPNITNEHFPVKGQGKVKLNIQLLHYDKYMESDGIIQDMESCSLRPATLPELLAFGAKYPRKPMEFPIIALGSIWQHPDGTRRVVSLFSGGFSYELGLDDWVGGWFENCRFAAVRK